MKAMVLNPILGKELRSRMRTWKSPLMISLYLGLLGLITLAYYWMQQKNYYYGFGPDVGPQIYIILAVFQLLLLSFVTPALTAGVINGERERQTFDLLLCTRLSAASIVWNKLLASISYVILLLVASLPVFGIVYFFGGVLLSDIGRCFLVYLVTAVTFGIIGIFCSTLLKRTQVSMVVTYIIVLFFLVGTLALSVFFQGIQNNMYPSKAALYISYTNPMVALFSIFPTQGLGIDMFSRYVNMGSTMPAAAAALSPWHYNFVICGVLSLVLLLITIIMIDPVGRFKWLKGRKSQEQRLESDMNDEKESTVG